MGVKREAIIEVNDVYKNFRVYFDKGSMLKEQFVNPGRSRYEEREILKGISFKVYRGETVALIGQNGCGKSTTLKMLTKIMYPNKGSVAVIGKVSSLIELGAGFHPDMSGRENIYINASILGIKKDEVDKRIDEIIRFSELEEFIDNPIRTYSSGMYMRLAFSVAINVDADILLIDEILAVGDQAFQEKCIRKLDELRSSGVTVVLVSHSMGQIKEIADRCIWIEDGRIREDGDTKEVCDHYEEAMTRRREERDEMEEEQRRTEAEKTNIALDEAGMNESSFDEDVKEYSVSELVEIEKKSKKEAKEKRRIEKIRRQKEFSSKWQGGGNQGIPVEGVAIIALMILLGVCSGIYMIGLNELPEDVVPVFERSIWHSVMGYIFFVLGRISIPMMLILLGFEILPRDYSVRERRLEYYGRVFLPAFATWQVWVIFYQVFFHFWDGRGFDIMRWLKEAFLIEYVDISHLWVFRFVGIFLLIAPYVSLVLQKFNVGMLRFLMIIVWLLIFLFPGLDLYGQVNGGEKSFPLPLGTYCYFFYFCLGYLVSRYMQRILKGSQEVALFVITFALTVWSQLLFDETGIDYLIKPTYFGISLMALFGFDLLVRVKMDDMYPKVSVLFKEIYKCVQVMFFIFGPVQLVLDRYFFKSWEVQSRGGIWESFWVTLGLWILTFAVSLGIVWAVRKVRDNIAYYRNSV